MDKFYYVNLTHFINIRVTKVDVISCYNVIFFTFDDFFVSSIEKSEMASEIATLNFQEKTHAIGKYIATASI